MTAKEMEKRIITELQVIVDEMKFYATEADNERYKACLELYNNLRRFATVITGKEITVRSWKVMWKED